MPYVALFTVAADVRNGRPPYNASKAFQPFMMATSLSSHFKGAGNPLRTDHGHPNAMEDMFDLVLLRSLINNTSISEFLT